VTYTGPDRRLTPRETDVVACLLAGQTAQEAAAELNLSRRTVEMHIARIADRLPEQYQGLRPSIAILFWGFDSGKLMRLP
jgi:FixJ family two-component response regulator